MDIKTNQDSAPIADFRRIIRAACSDAEAFEIDLHEHGPRCPDLCGYTSAASFRSWSFSKETEDVTYEEQDRAAAMCAALDTALPGWSFGRDDKNYFSGIRIHSSSEVA